MNLNYHIMSLSLNLALKHLEDGNIELAKHCINEAGQALDEMAKGEQEKHLAK